MPFLPNLGGSPVALDASSKIESGVAEGILAVRVGKGSREEGGVQEPGILKTEERRIGDGSGGTNQKRVVARSGTGERGKVGGRESRVPVRVEEGTIQLCKNRRHLPISPGKEAIAERKFKPGHVADESVERRGQAQVKVVVVFLRRVADEIKIYDDQLSSRNTRS